MLERVPASRTPAAIIARVHGAGIHLPLPGDGPAGFCASVDRLCAGQVAGGDRSRSRTTSTSFRNHGGFHEGTTIDIAKRVGRVCRSPNGCASAASWYRAAAFPSTSSEQSGEAPQGAWIPAQDGHRPIVAVADAMTPAIKAAIPRPRRWRVGFMSTSFADLRPGRRCRMTNFLARAAVMAVWAGWSRGPSTAPIPQVPRPEARRGRGARPDLRARSPDPLAILEQRDRATIRVYAQEP